MRPLSAPLAPPEVVPVDLRRLDEVLEHGLGQVDTIGVDPALAHTACQAAGPNIFAAH